jgi:dUTP pyrophosphatase
MVPASKADEASATHQPCHLIHHGQHRNSTMKLLVKKLNPIAILPTYATSGAACFDLHACTIQADVAKSVWQGHPLTIGTGLSFEIPPGYVMMVFSRSGHGFRHDTRLANCTGIIDSDYRGEVMVKLTCDRPDFGSDDVMPLRVKVGDRIAQAMIIPVHQCEMVECDQLSDTMRGSGGFGSTGA